MEWSKRIHLLRWSRRIDAKRLLYLAVVDMNVFDPNIVQMLLDWQHAVFQISDSAGEFR